MKNISYWAKCHVNSARILIVCIKFLLATLAYYTGMELVKMKIILPADPIYLAAFLLLVIVTVVYPQKKRTTLSKNFFYIKQKTCDFILPCCSFLVITTMVNNGDIIPAYAAYSTGIIVKPTAKEILASGKTRGQLTRTEKRILKKEFYKQLKIFAAAKITGNKETSGKAWKIVLAVVAMIGLVQLTAALACSLSCNGSEAAAVIVAVLGITGIIFAFVAVIKRIRRGPPDKEVIIEQG